VQKPDVEAQVDAEVLRIHSYYEDWPLYDCRDLDAVDVAQLTPLVGGHFGTARLDRRLLSSK
jgi:hypothetical protein